MNKEKGCRFVAYDAANGDYEEFDDIQSAKDWLTENDGEGISEEAENGANYIAEIKYRSKVFVVDTPDNYHVHTDECTEDCPEEEWPYDDEFSFIGKHVYQKIDWEDKPTVDVQIEGGNGDYSAYIASDNCPFGCIGEGKTIGSCIDVFLQAVDEMKATYGESNKPFPNITFVYHHS